MNEYKSIHSVSDEGKSATIFLMDTFYVESSTFCEISFKVRSIIDHKKIKEKEIKKLSTLF